MAVFVKSLWWWSEDTNRVYYSLFAKRPKTWAHGPGKDVATDIAWNNDQINRAQDAQLFKRSCDKLMGEITGYCEESSKVSNQVYLPVRGLSCD